MRTYQKHIACLEGEWSPDPGKKLSVKPLLDLVQAVSDVQVYYRRVATRGELAHHVKRLKSLKRYKVVYFASHGDPGHLWLNDRDQADKIALDDLARMMGTGFRGRVMHFGSCATLNLGPAVIQAFHAQTGALMVTGYARNVDWVDSTAFELVYLTRIQEYIRAKAFESRLGRQYQDLSDSLGFVVYR